MFCCYVLPFVYFFCSFFQFKPAANIFLYPHISQYDSCPTFKFEPFLVVDSWSTSTRLWPNTPERCTFLWCWRDGWWKGIDPHGTDISQADKWQPQTWKAISRLRQEWSQAKPWFPWASLPQHRPVPGHDMVVSASTATWPFWPSLFPGLRADLGPRPSH